MRTNCRSLTAFGMTAEEERQLTTDNRQLSSYFPLTSTSAVADFVVFALLVAIT